MIVQRPLHDLEAIVVPQADVQQLELADQVRQPVILLVYSRRSRFIAAATPSRRGLLFAVPSNFIDSESSSIM